MCIAPHLLRQQRLERSLEGPKDADDLRMLLPTVGRKFFDAGVSPRGPSDQSPIVRALREQVTSWCGATGMGDGGQYEGAGVLDGSAVRTPAPSVPGPFQGFLMFEKYEAVRKEALENVSPERSDRLALYKSTCKRIDKDPEGKDEHKISRELFFHLLQCFQDTSSPFGAADPAVLARLQDPLPDIVPGAWADTGAADLPDLLEGTFAPESCVSIFPGTNGGREELDVALSFSPDVALPPEAPTSSQSAGEDAAALTLTKEVVERAEAALVELAQHRCEDYGGCIERVVEYVQAVNVAACVNPKDATYLSSWGKVLVIEEVDASKVLADGYTGFRVEAGENAGLSDKLAKHRRRVHLFCDSIRGAYLANSLGDDPHYHVREVNLRHFLEEVYLQTTTIRIAGLNGCGSVDDEGVLTVQENLGEACDCVVYTAATPFARSLTTITDPAGNRWADYAFACISGKGVSELDPYVKRLRLGPLYEYLSQDGGGDDHGAAMRNHKSSIAFGFCGMNCTNKDKLGHYGLAAANITKCYLEKNSGVDDDKTMDALLREVAEAETEFCDAMCRVLRLPAQFDDPFRTERNASTIAQGNRLEQVTVALSKMNVPTCEDLLALREREQAQRLQAAEAKKQRKQQKQQEMIPTHECAGCKVVQDRNSFSTTQWKKRQKRKPWCKDCLSPLAGKQHRPPAEAKAPEPSPVARRIERDIVVEGGLACHVDNQNGKKRGYRSNVSMVIYVRNPNVTDPTDPDYFVRIHLGGYGRNICGSTDSVKHAVDLILPQLDSMIAALPPHRRDLDPGAVLVPVPGDEMTDYGSVEDQQNIVARGMHLNKSVFFSFYAKVLSDWIVCRRNAGAPVCVDELMEAVTTASRWTPSASRWAYVFKEVTSVDPITVVVPPKIELTEEFLQKYGHVEPQDGKVRLRFDSGHASPLGLTVMWTWKSLEKFGSVGGGTKGRFQSFCNQKVIDLMRECITSFDHQLELLKCLTDAEAVLDDEGEDGPFEDDDCQDQDAPDLGGDDRSGTDGGQCTREPVGGNGEGIEDDGDCDHQQGRCDDSAAASVGSAEDPDALGSEEDADAALLRRAKLLRGHTESYIKSASKPVDSGGVLGIANLTAHHVVGILSHLGFISFAHYLNTTFCRQNGTSEWLRDNGIDVARRGEAINIFRDHLVGPKLCVDHTTGETVPRAGLGIYAQPVAENGICKLGQGKETNYRETSDLRGFLTIPEDGNLKACYPSGEKRDIVCEPVPGGAAKSVHDERNVLDLSVSCSADRKAVKSFRFEEDPKAAFRDIFIKWEFDAKDPKAKKEEDERLKALRRKRNKEAGNNESGPGEPPANARKRDREAPSPSPTIPNSVARHRPEKYHRRFLWAHQARPATTRPKYLLRVYVHELVQTILEHLKFQSIIAVERDLPLKHAAVRLLQQCQGINAEVEALVVELHDVIQYLTDTGADDEMVSNGTKQTALQQVQQVLDDVKAQLKPFAGRRLYRDGGGNDDDFRPEDRQSSSLGYVKYSCGEAIVFPQASLVMALPAQYRKTIDLDSEIEKLLAEYAGSSEHLEVAKKRGWYHCRVRLTMKGGERAEVASSDDKVFAPTAKSGKPECFHVGMVDADGDGCLFETPTYAKLALFFVLCKKFSVNVEQEFLNQSGRDFLVLTPHSEPQPVCCIARLVKGIFVVDLAQLDYVNKVQARDRYAARNKLRNANRTPDEEAAGLDAIAFLNRMSEEQLALREGRGDTYCASFIDGAEMFIMKNIPQNVKSMVRSPAGFPGWIMTTTKTPKRKSAYHAYYTPTYRFKVRSLRHAQELRDMIRQNKGNEENGIVDWKQRHPEVQKSKA